MQVLIRLFFRGLRRILGPFMLLWEWLAQPSSLQRTPEAQLAVAAACQNLRLYQFKTCPFCIKVRLEMKRLGVKIEQFDAQHDQAHRSELLQGGGAVKVPCLRISEADGQVKWLYESSAIISYLQQRFAAS